MGTIQQCRFPATVYSNPLHKNRGTIPKRCHACRTTQMRWAFLIQLDEHNALQYPPCFYNTKRNRLVCFHRRQSSIAS